MANIGDIHAYVQGSGINLVVITKHFKFDTIRQEAYWVVKEVKQFNNAKKATSYCERIMESA